MSLIVLSGLGIGLVLGYALQRGRFCMNSATRDAVMLKDFTLLKAVGIAVLVSMIGFAVMDMTGIISIAPRPFFWGGNLVGSFVFGVGMVLAGACASGLTYRTGEGMVSAMVAALGLTAAAYFTSGGFLNPVAKSLQSSTTITTADGGVPTLATALGTPYYVLALVIGILGVVLWYAFGRNREAAEPTTGHGWNWLTTGIVIGLIAIVAFPLSAAAGRPAPIGITAGWVGLYKAIFEGGTFSWGVLLIVGIVLGALVAALVNREFKFRVPSAGMLAQVFVGGLLMGFGAVCSGGCNITHILSGLPQLALSSIVATVAIVAGAWFAAHMIFNVLRTNPGA